MLAENLVRFGKCPYEAAVRLGELRKHGLPIQIQEKSFDVLVAPLEHPRELVTREELQHRLWPQGISVQFEDGLNTAVNRLRDALRDNARRPKCVETLHRRGYRLYASYIRSSSPNFLIIPVSNAAASRTSSFHTPFGLFPARPPNPGVVTAS